MVCSLGFGAGSGAGGGGVQPAANNVSPANRTILEKQFTLATGSSPAFQGHSMGKSDSPRNIRRPAGCSFGRALPPYLPCLQVTLGENGFN